MLYYIVVPLAKRSALVTHALQATTAHTAEASIATAVQTNSVRSPPLPPPAQQVLV